LLARVLAFLVLGMLGIPSALVLAPLGVVASFVWSWAALCVLVDEVGRVVTPDLESNNPLHFGRRANIAMLQDLPCGFYRPTVHASHTAAE
jgi:hypothetical protein